MSLDGKKLDKATCQLSVLDTEQEDNVYILIQLYGW